MPGPSLLGEPARDLVRARLGTASLLAEAKETLHALKNPLYGISVATRVLSNSEESSSPEILEALNDAAVQALTNLERLTEIVAGLEARAREENA